MLITWTKLRTGEYGVRVPAEVPARAGAEVIVTRRDGETKTVILDRLVWQGPDVSLYTIRRERRYRPEPRRYVPCGYPGCSPGYCDECDGEGGRS